MIHLPWMPPLEANINRSWHGHGPDTGGHVADRSVRHFELRARRAGYTHDANWRRIALDEHGFPDHRLVFPFPPPDATTSVA